MLLKRPKEYFPLRGLPRSLRPTAPVAALPCRLARRRRLRAWGRFRLKAALRRRSSSACSGRWRIGHGPAQQRPNGSHRRPAGPGLQAPRPTFSGHGGRTSSAGQCGPGRSWRLLLRKARYAGRWALPPVPPAIPGFGARYARLLFMPRARAFSLCPAYPHRQGGPGYPCPALAGRRIHAPPSALPAWPLAGQPVHVRGARRGAVVAPGVAAGLGVRCGFFLSFVRGVSGFLSAAAVGPALAVGRWLGAVGRLLPLAVAPVGSLVLGRGRGRGLPIPGRRRCVRRRLGLLVRLPAGGAPVRRAGVGRLGAGGAGALPGRCSGPVAAAGLRGAGLRGVGPGRSCGAAPAVGPGRLGRLRVCRNDARFVED